MGLVAYKKLPFILSFQLTGQGHLHLWPDQQVFFVLAKNVFSLKKRKLTEPPKLCSNLQCVTYLLWGLDIF